MPMINIEDTYILGETGAQVDKVTGLFTKDEDTTSGEKAFAQLNIGTAGSNRNLLDNPWWGSNEVVNQRGVTSGTTPDNKYFIDRWMTMYNGAGGAAGTYSVGTGGITFTPYTGTLNGCGQKLANAGTVRGKVCTASFLLNDGTIKSASAIVPTSGAVAFNMGNNYNASITTADLFRVFVPASTIRAVKLELGSVSTLANDAPPEYAEELMKCNFYDIMLKTSAQYGYLGYGIADSATSATILIPLPNNMRDATPTITTGGTIAVKGGTSGTHTITGITFKLRVTGGVLVTVATTGLTTGEFCLLQLNNTSSYINISADL